MGGAHSAQMAQVKLEPQEQPVVAFSRRFCLPRVTTLHEKHGFLPAGITFEDDYTGGPAFIIQGDAFTSRKTLCDGNKTAIVTFKGVSLLNQPILSVRDCGKDSVELFQIYADYSPSRGAVVRVEFDEIPTMVRCEMGFSGDWRRRDAIIWLDRGRVGVRKPVAKVLCDPGVLRKNYRIQVAPNMDTALIALICGILSDKDRWKPVD